MEFARLLHAFDRYVDTAEQRKEDNDFHVKVYNELEEALREFVDDRIERALARRDGGVVT